LQRHTQQKHDDEHVESAGADGQGVSDAKRMRA